MLSSIAEWEDFSEPMISDAPEIHSALAKPCSSGSWVPWVAEFARVIYNERGLESLYDKILITRVNMALEEDASNDRDEIATFVLGPGFFESHNYNDPESRTGKILPDWIVVQGDFSCHTDSLPSLAELVRDRKILAVGDKKLTRQAYDALNESKASSADDCVPWTESCLPSYIAQVQQYAVDLYTRFAFILTERELVLVQFVAETETTPRKPGGRGLRSESTWTAQWRELPSDFRTSDPIPEHGGHDGNAEASLNP